jgi:hypothetical protein
MRFENVDAGANVNARERLIDCVGDAHQLSPDCNRSLK